MTLAIRLSLALLAAVSAQASIITALETEHFFGGTPGPGRLESYMGSFNPAGQSVALSFNSGGITPNTFQGSASSSAGPLLLTASASVNAFTPSELNDNDPPMNSTNRIALSRSRIQDGGAVITGGVGSGRFLPVYRVYGSFNNAHSQGRIVAQVCSGLNGCGLGVAAANNGGAESFDVIYSPNPGSHIFTFGQPFNVYFFITLLMLMDNGAEELSPGQMSGAVNLEILGYSIVDSNNNPVPSAQLTSDLFNNRGIPSNPVPEPGSFALVTLGGVAALLARSKFSAR